MILIHLVTIRTETATYQNNHGKLSFTRKEQSMGCTFIRRLYWIKNLEIRARAEFDGHATLGKGTNF